MRLNKSCKKADLGMAAVGNLRALYLDSRGRIKLLLIFDIPMQLLFSFSSFRKTFMERGEKKEKEMVEGSGCREILK